MKPTRIAGAITALAAVAILSGCGLTHHTATPAIHAAPHQARTAAQAIRPVNPALAIRPVNPALAWLDSAGGQAQVTFNQDVDLLAGDLIIENQVGSTANHLAFEADARAVRAQARAILDNPALLPAVHRAAYQAMLNDFITVADMLQPGPDYGTTAQDYTAWYTALRATNITVS
jgi:hypothetical protein